MEVKVAKPAEEMRRNEPKISTGPYGGGNRDRSMYSAGGGYSYPDVRAAGKCIQVCSACKEEFVHMHLGKKLTELLTKVGS